MAPYLGTVPYYDSTTDNKIYQPYICSLSPINLTQKKPYATQILSYKIFRFCEQTLKIVAK
jgi:hypothetical protein